MEEVIRAFTPTGNYIYDRQLIMELYETRFGIHNHLDNPNPLASVKFNPAENQHRNFLYEGYLRKFVMNDMAKQLGMSFDEYLNRPRYEIVMLNDIVADENRKKQEINKTLIDNLQGQADKMKQSPTQ